MNSVSQLPPFNEFTAVYKVKLTTEYVSVKLFTVWFLVILQFATGKKTQYENKTIKKHNLKDFFKPDVSYET